MASIFTKIINREIPAFIVAEDDSNLAFLDINPISKGHTLVVPKKEVNYLFDLDDDTYLSLQQFTKKVALAVKGVIPCLRIGTAVVGLEVPHTHIHLIPLNSMADFSFSNPKLSMGKEELEEIAKKINSAFQNL